MKYYFFLFVLFVLNNEILSQDTPQGIKHLETIHQYITREAFTLLKNQSGAGIPFITTIESHLGYNQKRNRPFIDSWVVAGNYDADHHDAIHLYNRNNAPDFQPFTGLGGFAGLFADEDPWVSITHFWIADKGDYEKTVIEGTYTSLIKIKFYIYNVPNAYESAYKICYDGIKYAFKIPDDVSGNNLTFQRESGGIINVSDSIAALNWNYGLVYLKYNNLRELYSTKRVLLKWAKDERVGSITLTNWTPNWKDAGYVILTDQQRDFVIYDILGRLCHYLQDMSVPAHTRRDIHGSDDEGIRQDYYEQYFVPIHFTEYNNSNVDNFLNPYIYTNTNPLHFLMYTTNQIANWFSSNGPYNLEGNEIFNGNGTSDEIEYLNQWRIWGTQNGLPPAAYPPRGDVNAQTAQQIFKFCFPQAIKSTAGLILWFIKEIFGTEVVTIENNFKSGIIKIDNAGFITSGSAGLWHLGTNHSLFGPDQHAKENNNPNNPQLWWIHQNWRKGSESEVTINPFPLYVDCSTSMLANYSKTILTTLYATYPEGEVRNDHIFRIGGKAIYEASSFNNYPVSPNAQDKIEITAIPPNNFVFYKWDDDHYINTRWFSNSPVNKNVLLKKHLASNDSYGLSTNSQRKFLRTYDGNLHLVYKSLNNIWYERSTNNGQTWELKLICENCSDPSMDLYLDTISIAYRQFNEIRIVELVNGNFIYENSFIPSGISENSQLVIASGKDYRIIAWLADDNKIKVKYLYREQATNFNWKWSNEINVPSHANSMSNPIIIKSDLFMQSEYEKKLFFFYQENLNSGSFISYYPLEFLYNGYTNFALSFYEPNYVNVSFGCGFSHNYNPSVISVNNVPYICWIGERKYLPTNSIEPIIQKQVLFTSLLTLGNFKSFGENVSSVNINRCNTRWTLAWARNNALPIQYIDSRGNLIRQINLNGKDVQISNGILPEDMFALAFNTKSLPYTINIKPIYPRYIPEEIVTTTKSREGIVTKDNGQIFYSFGEIEVDGNKIDFVEMSDTVKINTINDANRYLISQPFYVEDNSEFYYSIKFGISDSTAVKEALADNEFVNFKIELIDANTNEILGVLDDVTYDQNNVSKYENISYQVNTNGIGNRIVRLRLVITTNIDPFYAITDKYFDESNTLAKKNVKTISYKGKLKVYEYSLHQNYPNPFNPMTKIKYSVKEEKLVTIKLFDMLGREVTTLINEVKSPGEYELELDGGKLGLSSGVYLYQMRSEDFSSIKKLVFLK